MGYNRFAPGGCCDEAYVLGVLGELWKIGIAEDDSFGNVGIDLGQVTGTFFSGLVRKDREFWTMHQGQALASYNPRRLLTFTHPGGPVQHGTGTLPLSSEGNRIIGRTLTYDPTTDVWYYTGYEDQVADPQIFDLFVYTVTTTCQFTFVGTNTADFDTSFRPICSAINPVDGALYIIGRGGGGNLMAVSRVNKATLALEHRVIVDPVLETSTAVQTSWGACFNSKGELYVAYDRDISDISPLMMRKINHLTGQTLFGPPAIPEIFIGGAGNAIGGLSVFKC